MLFYCEAERVLTCWDCNAFYISLDRRSVERVGSPENAVEAKQPVSRIQFALMTLVYIFQVILFNRLCKTWTAVSNSRLMVAHAPILLPIELLKKLFFWGSFKLCSKFGEYGSIDIISHNLVHRRRTQATGHANVILYFVQCYAVADSNFSIPANDSGYEY